MLTGLALSFPLEALVRPGVASPWQRPLSALAVHCALWLTVFLFELSVFLRPWFAASVALSFLTILVLVNNAKFHALREPFIAQDFEYFLDTIRFPRLYLPFFGIGKAILATIAVVAAIGLGLYLEPPLTASLPRADVLWGIGLLATLTLGLALFGTRRPPPLTFDPIQDIQAHGFLGSMPPYLKAEQINPECSSPFHRRLRASKPLCPLPNLVAVQSESFFDPRKWCAAIDPHLLSRIDALKKSAAAHGHLHVPAWGANTVRTEFAFLSGLSSAHIGVHRFNPYRKLARWSPQTIATLLRQWGYQTVCIHPYPAEFYGRKKVFPLLGFDRFIDIQHFDAKNKSGPYIGDVTLAETICAEMSQISDQPVFVFAITMENHGPLHWEQPLPGEVEQYCTGPLVRGCEDLIIYLRHLRNADQMAGMLAECLQSLDREAWLCWYGDHVPIMPEAYKALGNPPGTTDYFLWSNKREQGKGQQGNLQVEQLGLLLLREMGLIEAETV